jgi:Ser/Thr protein kinase RdoA (MazF antagonist)
VSELAVALSSVLHHAGAEPASVLAAMHAFHSIRPLSMAEVEVLWPLVVLRTAGCARIRQGVAGTDS